LLGKSRKLSLPVSFTGQTQLLLFDALQFLNLLFLGEIFFVLGLLCGIFLLLTEALVVVSHIFLGNEGLLLADCLNSLKSSLCLLALDEGLHVR